MQLQRKALIKWTLITVFCGANSFFWGILVKGHIATMLAGLATFILMFSLIESHPRYQAKRAANLLLARALDIGIKVRLCVAAYIITCGLFALDRNPGSIYLLYPLMGELWIGMGASWLCQYLTGVTLDPELRHHDTHITRLADMQAFGLFDQILATYTTTIITGLMHTAILAFLCGIIYVFLQVKSRYSST